MACRSSSAACRPSSPAACSSLMSAEALCWEVTAVFEMNLVERLARPGAENLRSRSLYAAKNSLAALHRRAPALRGPLTATSRRAAPLVRLGDDLRGGGLHRRPEADVHDRRGGGASVGVALVPADLPRDVTEVVVMNEQGARRFDRYVDAEGATLQGAAIGTWDEVAAATASFVSTAHRVAFSLGQVEGARLHRGRELIGSRVAWSGFGYSFPPTAGGVRLRAGGRPGSRDVRPAHLPVLPGPARPLPVSVSAAGGGLRRRRPARRRARGRAARLHLPGHETKRCAGRGRRAPRSWASTPWPR